MSDPSLSSAPLWYLSRSTGIVSFVLITLALVLGIASTQRALASPAWPRFATQGLHRNVSLLGLGFLVVHIVATIADGYVDISWFNVLIPGLSDYRRLWVALGTIAFDIVLAVIITSLVRWRMNATYWRWLHYTVYAAWPFAWLHFLKTGTDSVHGRFGVYIAVGAAAIIGLAVGARTTLRDTPAPVKSVVR